MEDLLALAATPQAWAALATLVVMEVVLGIDNLIFISILTNKLPEHQRSRARRVGIGLAVILRLGLLASVAIIAQLTQPLFSLFDHGFSWRDLILIAGGLFLIWKATSEIHDNVAGETEPEPTPAGVAGMTMAGAIGQILLLDLVFSLDSIITAVGMTDDIPIMVLAVLIAVGLMLMAADPLARFIGNNPTIVMLALGFLLLIGGSLLAEGMGVHVPKGYIYAAMAFSALIEGLNMLARRRRDLGHDASGKLARRLERCLRGFRQRTLLVAGDENGRAILPSLVAELTVCIQGIDVAPEHLEQPLIRHACRVVLDLQSLVVAGASTRYFLVARIDLHAAGVAGPRADDAIDLVERRFHAPEAAAGENRNGARLGLGRCERNQHQQRREDGRCFHELVFHERVAAGLKIMAMPFMQ